MPGGKKPIPGATAKETRMYESIKSSELSRGTDLATSKRIAAATTNKLRTKRGETKASKGKKS